MLARDRRVAGERHVEPRQRAGRGDRRAVAEPREIKLIDDGGVGIGDHVDGEAVAVLEGVDMMEGEAWLGVRGAHDLAAVLLDDMEYSGRAPAPSDSSG